MNTFLKPYLAALLVMGLLDALWLGAVARDFYRQEMGALMAEQVRWVPALLFYFGYPAALVVLKLDDEGALLEGPQLPRVHVPAADARLLDATGAGDAFGGAFLAEWLRHGEPARAARVAVQVGGWVVSRFGARPPVDDELRNCLKDVTA